jgi:hypothetical protein
MLEPGQTQRILLDPSLHSPCAREVALEPVGHHPAIFFRIHHPDFNRARRP